MEKVLSPARSCHKKKFELGLEPLTYLSCPIFIREDGHWRKKKRGRKKNTAVDENDDLIQDIETDPRDFASMEVDVDDVELMNGDDDDDDDNVVKGDDVREKGEVRERKSGDNKDQEEDGKSTTSEDDRQTMSMFNMVFVMNPPVLEHNLRIKEMFEYVVRKFAKALKHEQARSNWVWKQSEMILSMKERAKEEGIYCLTYLGLREASGLSIMLGRSSNTLWKQILAKSSLAKAMSEVYHSISTSRIAHVFINKTFDRSLQIPQISSISELPTVIEPQMPGTWLTTASSIEDDESLDSNTLAKHFALLLLDDVDNILKDIDHEHGSRDLSHPLAEFVQIVKPTMSYVFIPLPLASHYQLTKCHVRTPNRFLQISQTHSLSLRRIQVLSRYLIYWRRAIAIPPLHQRDKYIVSPNAAMSQLPRATKAYATKFPSLPSLPKMLSMLSGHPRAYSTLIPSKDHREAYLEILAWLMKGGWVTQLRVFGWVRVSKEIKAMVRNDDNSNNHNNNSLSPRKEKEDTEMDHFSPENHTRSTTLLLDPHKANALESRWLDAIASNLDDPDVREVWPRLVRYFNGQHALEKIAVREGFKRKDVWRWLSHLESKGILVVVRHW